MVCKSLLKGRALYQTPDKIWIAKGMTFYAIDYNGRRVTRRYTVGGIKDRILGTFRLPRQLLRLGLHHLIPLNDDNVLVTAKRITYIIAPDGKVVNTFTGYQGNKPGHQGICVTSDGTIFFAEYLLNPNRDHVIRLYRSSDNGRSFHVIKEWPKGDIRHLHFVKWDSYEECLWVGTGDYGEDNKENRLYRSGDNGNTWELIGEGSQDWRAIGICFTKDALLWGTDAGSCPDTVHLVKMDRKNKHLEMLEDLEGPCHGCATYKDGRVFFSTGVEGGENEKDKYARLKLFEKGKTQEICRFKKDIFPYVLQIGALRFPLGTENCNKVVFTAMGLKHNGEKIIIER